MAGNDLIFDKSINLQQSNYNKHKQLQRLCIVATTTTTTQTTLEETENKEKWGRKRQLEEEKQQKAEMKLIFALTTFIFICLPNNKPHC